MITVVLTSCDRLDLLKITIDSFNKFNTYPIKEFIIVDDSGNEAAHNEIRRLYPDYTLVLDPINRGQVECIDAGYSMVKTPYIFHCEDDWEFLKPSFIEPSLKILEHDKRVMLVNLLTPHIEIEPEVFDADGVKYRLIGNCPSNWWHGFTWNPALRRLADYDIVKPYTQYATSLNSSVTECHVGMRLYDEFKFKAAVLFDTYVQHTGTNRMKRK